MSNKFMDTVKKIDWINVGAAVVGVAGLALGGLQKKQSDKLMDETIQKKVAEAVENLNK